MRREPAYHVGKRSDTGHARVKVLRSYWKELYHIEDFAQDGVEVWGGVIALENVVELDKEPTVDERPLCPTRNGRIGHIVQVLSYGTE